MLVFYKKSNISVVLRMFKVGSVKLVNILLIILFDEKY